MDEFVRVSGKSDGSSLYSIAIREQICLFNMTDISSRYKAIDPAMAKGVYSNSKQAHPKESAAKLSIFYLISDY